MPGDITDEFYREFNRRLGKNTGGRIVSRPVTGPDAASSTSLPSPVSHGESGREVQRKISSGIYDLDTNAEKSYERVFGEASTEGVQANVSRSRMLDRQAKARTRKLQQEAENTAKVLEEKTRIDSAIKGIEEKSGGWRGMVSSVMDSPFGRALDLIQRPDYAVMEGARSVAEQSRESNPPPINGKEYTVDDINAQLKAETEGKKWYDINEDVKAFGTGFWRGLSGQAKTGFGDVVEEAHPELSLNTKRALGIGGDLFLAPTNYAGGAVVKTVRGTGRELTQEVLERTARTSAARNLHEGARTGVLDVGKKNIPMPGTGKMTNPRIAYEATLANKAKELTEGGSLRIKGGGIRGRLNLGGKTNYARTVSQGVAESYRKVRLRTFDNYMVRFRQHAENLSQGGKGTLGQAAIQVMKNNDNFFKTFYDQWDVATRGGSKKSFLKTADDVAENVRNGINKEIDYLADSMFDDLKDLYYTAPGIRIAGKVVPFNRVGRMVDTTFDRIGKRYPKLARRAITYEQKFPGRLSLLSQRVKSIGIQNFDNYAKTVRAMAKTIKHEDAIRIQHAIEEGIDFPTEPELQAAKDWVQIEYMKMFFEEQKAGVRNLKGKGSVMSDRYTFVWNKGGDPKKRVDFKVERKTQINDVGNAVGYKTADAKKAGFNPVENAFEALLYRKMKSNRDMTKGWFLSDLLNNYGFMGKNITGDSVKRRNLVKINENRLGEQFTQAMTKRGDTYLDSWYLPKEIDDVFREYENLAKMTSDHPIVSLIRKMTQFYKSSVTVYMPGYHVRNMVSDMFMGMLDGVPMRTYTEVIRKSRLFRNSAEKIPIWHPTPNSTYEIVPGWNMTGPELWDKYQKNAASGGFVSADLSRANEFAKVRGAVGRGVRQVSESREDFGRVVHFLHALRQEAKGLGVKAESPKAIEQAVYRVNHYKFDYGALTKGEQRYAKLIFPFYTFTRKAVPTIIESAFLNPKNLVRVNKFQQQRDGSGADFFNHAYIPEWMREVGFATLTDEEQPLALTADILPQSVLQNVQPYPFDAKNIANQVLSQMNPLAQTIPELSYDREAFSGRDVGPYQSYFGRKVGPVREIMDLAQASGSDEPMLQRILQSRLIGPGLPLRRVTKGQQIQQMHQWEDQIIDAPFEKFNDGEGKDKGIRVYTSRRSEGSSYQVKDARTGRIIFDTTDPEEALDFAKGDKAKAADIPMPLEDFNEFLGKESGIRIYYSQRKEGKSYRVKNMQNDKVLFDSPNVKEAYDFAESEARARGGKGYNQRLSDYEEMQDLGY